MIEQSSNFYTNFRKFVRLIPLRSQPLESKYIQDELDVLYCLDAVKQMFYDTAAYLGKSKYQGQPFDFIREVKEEVQEWLLVGNTDQQTAHLKRKNLIMYHMVLEPLIDLFANFTHEEALSRCDETFELVKQTIENHDIETTYDDAIVAREQIQQIVREREELRKATLKKRKTRKNKMTFIEEFLPEEPLLEELVFEM
jgi:hypothetical protein